jgi:hypothetical protein
MIVATKGAGQSGATPVVVTAGANSQTGLIVVP